MDRKIFSKKYSRVYQPLIERIFAEESAKYEKEKEIIKAVKNRLHMIYGAFREASSQASNERQEFIREFYSFISDVSKDVRSVLDIGCGSDPFALPVMLEFMPNIEIYHAFDIDTELAESINEYFSSLNLPQCAGCMDIITETPSQTADIAFLFKIIPTVESCKKGRGFEIINSINAKYLAVSFPTKTLCGKNKGMAENYAAFFEKNLDYEKFDISGKNFFKNELVYVIARKSY